MLRSLFQIVHFSAKNSAYSRNLIQRELDYQMNQKQGQIQLILGPMFSGKTSELMRLVKRFTIAERECLVLNYSRDNRYGAEGKISTHDQQHFTALKVQHLKEVENKVKNYDVVAIDEAQFFDDISEFCEEQANQGKIVIVAALDGTFERKAFNRILELIPLCEKVKKLTAVCWYCKKDNASFTKRTVKSKEIELIGGDEMYKPSCRQCFNISHSANEKLSEKLNKENNYGEANNALDKTASSKKDKIQGVQSIPISTEFSLEK